MLWQGECRESILLFKWVVVFETFSDSQFLLISVGLGHFCGGQRWSTEVSETMHGSPVEVTMADHESL